MNPLTFGIALWVLFGFMVAFAVAPRLNHSATPTPNEDAMNRNEYPASIANDNGWDYEHRMLDAFCSGYARALLWADAFRYISEDECMDADGEYELVQDEDAAYAYDSPGRWWEGMGIDFTDAVSFLVENMGTLTYLPSGDFENDWDFWSQHGHDFLLTRNHHGAGFWDRGYPYAIANMLTDRAHNYGGHQVLTDDSPRVTTL